MVRAQVEAVAAAASQPVLLQVAQEAAMKDMASRFEAMSERLMSDPDIRHSAEQMQERLMADPETRQLLEELMRRLGGALPPDVLN
jgi:D-alanyl-D-alanine dipeptidase